MKSFLKNNFLLVMLFLILLVGTVFAALQSTSGGKGYWIVPLTTESTYYSEIDAPYCYRASNSSLDKTLFIPTNSAQEIQAFHSNHPNYVNSYEYLVAECGILYKSCEEGSSAGLFSGSYSQYDQSGSCDLYQDWQCQTTCGVKNCSKILIGMGDELECEGDAGCFIAGTIITMADGTKKHVESVITGDILLGAGGTANTVEKLFKIDYRRKLYSLNGGKYFVSDTHPFMTTEGWKSFYPVGTLRENPDLAVSLLELGDVLVTETGLVQLLSTDYIYDRQYVYNFRTDGNHTYYADGFLVHNPDVKQQQQ